MIFKSLDAPYSGDVLFGSVPLRALHRQYTNSTSIEYDDRLAVPIRLLGHILCESAECTCQKPYTNTVDIGI